MKSLGKVVADAEAAAQAKRARHRKWYWCRRWNGFNDTPIFRVAARMAGMPLGQVQAFANRLEELANRSESRGCVGDFNAADFAAAQDITPEQAARIYAALEHKEVGWIDQDFVASFYARNKDEEEDTTQALRARRSYARKQIRKALARLAAEGAVSGADRDALEVVLDDLGDDELFELERARRIGQLPGAMMRCPQPHSLTVSHGFSHRENVSLTARADHTHLERPVDNFGDSVRGTTAGLSEDSGRGESADPQAAAALWLKSEGLKIIVGRMEDNPGLAATRIERWLQQRLGGDAVALREIIEGVRSSDLTPARFLVEIDKSIERWKQKPQPQLNLPQLIRAKAVGHG